MINQFYNPYIGIPMVAWAMAQIIKFMLAGLRGRIDFRLLYASGGMPSAHSAAVSSLAMVALVRDGFNTQIFGLSAMVAAIVIYDSFGVRRAAGEQAVAINKLWDSITKNPYASNQRVREALGHKPIEVIVGVVLGVSTATIFNIGKLGVQLLWLGTNLTKLEQIVVLSVSGFLIVFGLIVRIVLLKRFGKKSAWNQLSKQLFLLSQSFGWGGVVLVFAAAQKASYLAFRVWYLIAFITLMLVLVWQIAKWRVKLPQLLAESSEIERKQRWFKSKRPKRKKSK